MEPKNKVSIVLRLSILFGLFVFMGLSQSFTLVPSLILNEVGSSVDVLISNIIVIVFSTLFIVISNLLAYQLGAFKNETINYREIVLSIIAGICLVFAVKFLFSQVIPNDTKNQIIAENMLKNLSLSAKIFYVGILVSVTEELVFRFGFMNVLFKNNRFIGLLISSIVFGLTHNVNDLWSGLLYVSVGLIFGFTYFYTDRLEVPIIIHIVNNIIGILSM